MNFRIARHTDNFEPLLNFYINLLGLEFLGEFKNHNNYYGIFIGKKGLDWHLEFTKSDDKANHHFDEDDLLVFYPKTESEYISILLRLEKNGIKQITPKNPYWNNNGIMVQDPDGFRIVISSQKFDKN